MLIFLIKIIKNLKTMPKILYQELYLPVNLLKSHNWLWNSGFFIIRIRKSHYFFKIENRANSFWDNASRNTNTHFDFEFLGSLDLRYWLSYFQNLRKDKIEFLSFSNNFLSKVLFPRSTVKRSDIESRGDFDRFKIFCKRMNVM